MVLFNYSTRELTAKIVYYGPGLCGKTTNLQYIHDNLPGEVKGKMLSLATKTDRTLFFDFLPIDLGEIRGMKTRVQLYTVPGQVFYNETRKLVLKGADGIVFVADSQETMLGANVESFKNLEENLKAHGMKLGEMPHVIQFNKRDLPKLASIEDLNAALNKFNAPFYESVATTGIGVQDTLKAIVKLVLLHLTKKYDPKAAQAVERGATAEPAARAPVTGKPAAAPAPPRADVPVAVAAAPQPSPRARAAAPAPAPAFRAPAGSPPPVEPLPAFGDDEIDGLVGEVEEVDTPPSPQPAVEPRAESFAEPAPAEPIEEEGIWLGSSEPEEESAFATPEATYGANASLEDLLAKSEPEPAPSEPLDAPAWPPLAELGSEFEVDRGFDPEWTPASDAAPEPVEPPTPPAPPPAARAPRPAPPPPPPEPEEAPVDETLPLLPEPEPGPEATAEPEPRAAFDEPERSIPLADRDEEGADGDVLLTEVADDDALFEDPDLDVAKLEAGDAKEIVVPVLLGRGNGARRFKLTIRMKLDPVD